MRMLNKLSAFSLLEASIGLVIMGLVISTLVPAMHKYRHYYKHRLTQERAERISKRVQSWFSRQENKGRVLCPTQVTSYGAEAYGHGIDHCEVPSDRIGMVPYKDLELVVKDSLDGYGNPFTFVITAQKGEKDQNTVLAPSIQSQHQSIGSGATITIEGYEGSQTFRHDILGIIIAHGSKGMGSFDKKSGERMRREITLKNAEAKRQNAKDDMTFSTKFKDLPLLERDEIFLIYST